MSKLADCLKLSNLSPESQAELLAAHNAATLAGDNADVAARQIVENAIQEAEGAVEDLRTALGVKAAEKVPVDAGALTNQAEGVTVDREGETSEAGRVPARAGRAGGARAEGRAPVAEDSAERGPRDGEGGDAQAGVPGGRAEGPGNVPEPAGRESRADGGQEQGGAGVSGDTGRPAEHSRPGRSGAARGLNYRITDPASIGKGGAKTQFRNNLKAIKLLKELEAEKRLATAKEQEVLARYYGFGGIGAQLFNDQNADWADERQELKDATTPEEYNRLRDSIINAHFTDPEIVGAIWKGLQALGFKGGAINEPAIGSGIFFGMMPDEIAQNSRLSASELDPLTARLAGQLYQNATVENAGFQDLKIPDNSMDMFVSNVPFANLTIIDASDRTMKANLHDFFFQKALRKTRPGGLVVFITSKGSLDKFDSSERRKWQGMANLVGAVRLPYTAFKGKAKTDVVTDLVVFQKRAEGAPASGPDFLKTAEVEVEGEKFLVNEYFQAHPENVLGKFAKSGKMYRAGSFNVEPNPGQDLAAALQERMATFKDQLDAAALDKVARKTEDAERKVYVGEAPEHLRDGNLYIVDGKVYQKEGKNGVELDLNPKWAVRVRDMIGVRDAARELLRLQVDPSAPDARVEGARKRLNKVYDAAVKAHGYLWKRENKAAMADDPDAALLLSLEDYDFDKKTASKADLFHKRTQNPVAVIESADNPADALTASLSERGGVDLEYMAKLTGTAPEELERQLAGVIFRAPTGEMLPANQYLAGNVREKLRDAEELLAADPKKYGYLEANVKALKAVQPPDLDPSKIAPRLGSPWIPPEVYEEFAEEVTGYRPRIKPFAASGSWSVSFGHGRHYSDKNNVVWGNDDMSASELIERTMNFQPIVIGDYVETTNTNGGKSRTFVVDTQKTALAKANQDKLVKEFERWLWADQARAEAMVRKYNDEMNNTIPAAWDGSHLRLPGLATTFTPRPLQKAAIWRQLQGNTLLWHEVGFGKTFEMAAAAMEMRRLGIANKPVFVVPNHLIEQWPAEFLRLYPGAKILKASKKDFEPLNRQRLMHRIATGDWDAVIVPMSSFEKLPMSPDVVMAYFQQQLDELESIIVAEKAEQGKKAKVKDLVRAKMALEARLERMAADWKKDAGPFFDQLGIDALFVDEAHAYKNLFFPTRMGRVPGVANSPSQRAFDMQMKTEFINKQGSGRGVVFGTGTPLTRSLAEIFTMQRYLQPSTLRQRGMHHFDFWAKNFGEVVSNPEVTSTGVGFKMHSRFARFVNTPELMQMFGLVTDIKTTKDAGIVLPPVKGGKPQVIEAPLNEHLRQYRDNLLKRVERIEKKKVDPSEDNMLKVTMDGMKAAMDLRLVGIDHDDPASKVNLCVAEVLKTWKDTKKTKATQIVWADLGVPDNKKAARFDVWSDIKRKLMAGGIPEDEIAFAPKADASPEKRRALFHAVKEGRVRVLIGSTARLGTGANIQDRLIRCHHLDAPWNPTDVEQRDGRMVRWGNQNPEVEITRYVAKGSFDARRWQVLETKAKFIHQLKTEGSSLRSVEDVGGQAMTAAEAKAAAADNPKLLEHVILTAEVQQLAAERSGYMANQWKQRQEAQGLPAQIKALQQRAEDFREFQKVYEANRAKEDAAAAKAKADKQEPAPYIEFKGKTYAKRADANAAMREALRWGMQAEGVVHGVRFRTAAVLGGEAGKYAPVGVRRVELFPVKGRDGFTADVGWVDNPEVGSTDAAAGAKADFKGDVDFITRIINALDGMGERAKESEGRAEDDAKTLAAVKVKAAEPWPKEDELKAKEAKLSDLTVALQLDKSADATAGDPNVGADTGEEGAEADAENGVKSEDEAEDAEDGEAGTTERSIKKPEEKPAAKKPVPFYRNTSKGWLPSPDAKSIEVKGAPDGYTFFAFKDEDGDWGITEASTGLLISDWNSTRKASLEEAEARIAKIGPEKFKERIDAAIKEKGKSPWQLAKDEGADVLGQDVDEAGLAEALAERWGADITSLVVASTYQEGRALSHAIKYGAEGSIDKAADLLGRKLPQGVVLVPVPSSSGKTDANRQFAEAVAKVAGGSVADILTGTARPSSYAEKKAGRPELLAGEMKMSLKAGAKVPDGPVYVLDNVIATGTTIRAAQRALGRPVGAAAFAITGDPHKTARESWEKQGTDSPWFKRWFGDSKVVNKRGKPQIVYHGSLRKFDVFDPEKMGDYTGAPSAREGFFFTNDRETARGYASRSGQTIRQGRDVIEAAEAEIKSLIGVDRHRAGFLAFHNKIEDPAKAAAVEAALERISDAEHQMELAADSYTADYRLVPGAMLFKGYLSIQNPLVHDQKGEDFRESSFYELIKRAKAEGRDGVIILNTSDPALESAEADTVGRNVYVAFRPEQIKSVKNRGTFSPENPSILGQDVEPGQPIRDAATVGAEVFKSIARKVPALDRYRVWKAAMAERLGAAAESSLRDVWAAIKPQREAAIAALRLEKRGEAQGVKYAAKAIGTAFETGRKVGKAIGQEQEAKKREEAEKLAGTVIERLDRALEDEAAKATKDIKGTARYVFRQAQALREQLTSDLMAFAEKWLPEDEYKALADFYERANRAFTAGEVKRFKDSVVNVLGRMNVEEALDDLRAALKEAGKSNLRPEYKKKLTELMDGLTAKRPSEETLRKAMALLSAEQHDEIGEIPKRILDKARMVAAAAGAKWIGDLNPEDMDALADAVRMLVRQSQLKTELIQAGRVQAVNALLDQAPAEVRGYAGAKYAGRPSQREKGHRLNRAAHNIATLVTTDNVSMENKVETLAPKGGAVYSILVEAPIYRASSEQARLELEDRAEAQRIVGEAIESEGLASGALGKIARLVLGDRLLRSWSRAYNGDSVTQRTLERAGKGIVKEITFELPGSRDTNGRRTGSVTMTLAEAGKLYAYLLDPGAREQLFAGAPVIFAGERAGREFTFTPEDARAFLAKLQGTADGRAMMRIVRELGESATRRKKEALNRVSLLFLGRELIEGDDYYTPIRRDQRYLEKEQDDILKELIGSAAIKKLSFLQERVDAEAPLVVGDFFVDHARSAQAQNIFIAKMEADLNARRLLRDPGFIKSVESAFEFGDEVLADIRARLKDWRQIDRVPTGTGERMAKWLAGNASIAKLGLNPATVAIQWTALINAANELNLVDVINGAVLTPGQAAEARKEIEAWAPLISARINESGSLRLSPFSSGSSIRTLYGGESTLADKSMLGIQKADNWGIYSIWRAVKNEARQKGLTGDAAMKYVARRAAEVVNKTQATWDPLTSSTLTAEGSSKPWQKLIFGMFSSQIVKQWNLAYQAVNQYKHSDRSAIRKAAMVARVSNALVIQGLLVYAMQQGIRSLFETDDDDERKKRRKHPAADWVVGATGSVIEGANPYGKFLSAAIRGLTSDNAMADTVRPDMLSGTAEGLIRGGRDIKDAVVQYQKNEHYQRGLHAGRPKAPISAWKGGERILRESGTLTKLPTGFAARVLHKFSPAYNRPEAPGESQFGPGDDAFRASISPDAVNAEKARAAAIVRLVERGLSDAEILDALREYLEKQKRAGEFEARAARLREHLERARAPMG